MLYLVVFVSGMAVLAVELSASRLLAPYFGTSLFVWANLIGLVLIYLTAGYALGGRLADRYPAQVVLYQITAWAAFAIGLIPFVSRPILQLAAQGFASYDLGVFWGSLVGVVLLFAAPITLLGCVAPFAIRLALARVDVAGNTAGSLYALSTLGSILGAFLPVLLLIPNIGTTRTFLVFSIALLLVSIAGLVRLPVARGNRRGATGERQGAPGQPATPSPPSLDRGPGGEQKRYPRLLLLYVIFLAVTVVLAVLPPGVVRAAPYGELLYETESAYNYIQVVRDGTRVDLVLNEGHAVHSIYDPTELLTGGPWDFFLLAPYFQPNRRPEEVRSLLLLGSAAGTVARQYTEVYGSIPIDGVEIDPMIIEVGRRYFAMTMPNLRAIAQDGRYFLRQTDRRYSVVGVDAYRQPYIPFHMTTQQFFREVRDHVAPGGVAAINAGRTDTDYRLVDVLAGTMKSVFPNVFVVDVPQGINSIVVGTTQPATLQDFLGNLQRLSDPRLRTVAAVAASHVREYTGPITLPAPIVFTDDYAPVEQVIDQIILGYVQAAR